MCFESTFPPVFLTWTFRRENWDGSLGASEKAAAARAFSWSFTVDLILSQPFCKWYTKSSACLCVIFSRKLSFEFSTKLQQGLCIPFYYKGGGGIISIHPRGEHAPRWGIWWGRYLQPPPSGPHQKVKEAQGWAQTILTASSRPLGTQENVCFCSLC